MLIEPSARDVLTADAEALEEGRRLAGICMGVVGNDGLADRGLARKAHDQGQQSIHQEFTFHWVTSPLLNLWLSAVGGAGYKLAEVKRFRSATRPNMRFVQRLWRYSHRRGWPGSEPACAFRPRRPGASCRRDGEEAGLPVRLPFVNRSPVGGSGSFDRGRCPVEIVVSAWLRISIDARRCGAASRGLLVIGAVACFVHAMTGAVGSVRGRLAPPLTPCMGLCMGAAHTRPQRACRRDEVQVARVRAVAVPLSPRARPAPPARCGH